MLHGHYPKVGTQLYLSLSQLSLWLREYGAQSPVYSSNIRLLLLDTCQSLCVLMPTDRGLVAQRICAEFWQNCGFDDKSMKFGMVVAKCIIVLVAVSSLRGLLCSISSLLIGNQISVHSSLTRSWCSTRVPCVRIPGVSTGRRLRLYRFAH